MLSHAGPKIWKNKALFDLLSWMDVIWPIPDLLLELGRVSWFSTPGVCTTPCSSPPCFWADSADTLPAPGCSQHPGTRAPVAWAQHFKSSSWHSKEIFWSEFGGFPKRPAPSRPKAYIISCKGPSSFQEPARALWNNVWLLRNPDKCSGCWRKHKAQTWCRGNSSELWVCSQLLRIWNTLAVCSANGKMNPSGDQSKPVEAVVGAAEDKREGNFKNNICLMGRSCSHY